MAAGVSTRRYARSLDRLPPAETERSTSKSAVSRPNLCAIFTVPPLLSLLALKRSGRGEHREDPR